MKRTIRIAVKLVAAMVLVGSFTGVLAHAQACADGVWTPAPVQQAESGNALNPAFHSVYGLSCGGNVYMIRFSNKVGAQANGIVTDILGKTAVGCSGGKWSPTPVQKAESGTPQQPLFHTVWGLA